MPKQRRKETRFQEMVRLGKEPSVKELDELFEDVRALQAKVREHRRKHPRTCKCPACVHLRARGGIGDYFATLETVLYACWALTDEERPQTADELIERDQKFREEHGVGA